MIELMAGYYEGSRPGTKAVKAFVTKYLGPHCTELKGDKVVGKWYDVFRNGLCHCWSPKCGAVAMDFKAQEVFAFWHPPEYGEEVPFLIVPKLYEVLKKALKQYEADLDSDQELRKAFQRRHAQIEGDSRRVMGELRKLCLGSTPSTRPS